MKPSVIEAGRTQEDRFIEHLLRAGRLDAEAADRARRVSGHSDASLTRVLLELALIPERELIGEFTAGLGIPVATADEFPLAPVLADSVSERFLHEHRTILLSATDDTVTIATADPLDRFTSSAVALATGRRVSVKVAPASDIEQALRRLTGDDAMLAQGVDAVTATSDASDADLARLRESASEAPVIRFVNTLISRAVEAGASDIHIEPMERRLRIRTRIDGVLKEEEAAPFELAPAILSRLKIMSGLNIAERRLPQDGAFKLAVRGREIDFRIATAPVAHGECAAIRILDRATVPLDLAALGFDAAAQARLAALLARPNGIILVTGPTGSGKTTTLYAALAHLNTVERKVLSVEDPVEYKVPGVNQIQVKPEIGLTFAHVLRSVLRHDPNVILVGEIRDPETARIAVQASLTGHLVLSTVHTNSAAAAITRLLDMGVEDYLLSSTVAGILSQRLVRNLCTDCREPVAMRPAWEIELKRAGLSTSGCQTYAPKGCPACHGTGYRGRTVIAELLVPDERVRRMIVERASAAALQAACVEQGMETLRRSGLRKFLDGTTSIDEVSRVAQEED